MELTECSGDKEDRGGEGPREGKGSFDAANLDLAILSFSFSCSLSFSFDFLLVGLTSTSLFSPVEGEGEGEDTDSSSSHIPGIEGAGARASRGGELLLLIDCCCCWYRGLIVTVARGGVGDAGEERPEGILNEFRS